MNFLASPDEMVIKQRFPTSDDADPCTKGILMFIYMKDNDEAILFLDNQVFEISLNQLINNIYN